MNDTSPARAIELGSGILLFLALLPFLAWAYFLNQYGVEIPYQDQWDTPYRAIYEAASGNFSFATYFLQHNEARKVVPTALSAGLAALMGKWDTKTELFIGFSLCAVLVTALFAAARRTHALSQRDAAFLTFLFSWLLWSPLTWYFHTWSITFERLIPEASLIVGAWLALKGGGALGHILVFALLAAVAQYSYPGGVILWPLLGLLLIRQKLCGDQVRWGSLALYALLFALSVTAYFNNYQHPPHHTPLSAVLDQSPLVATGFFLAFLGRPFANTPLLMAALGGVSLLLFGIGLYRAQQEQSLGVRTWVWAVVGFYSISQGLLVTAGRLPMAPGSILRQDYVTHGIYLLVAGVALNFSSSSNRFEGLRRAVIPVALIILIVTFASGIESPSALERMRKWHQDLTAARSCLLIANHFGESLNCPGELYPEPNIPISKASLGLKYGFLNLGKFQEISEPASGHVDSYIVTANGIKMSGWARSGLNRADVVIVLRDKNYSGNKLIAMFPVKDPRPDVAEVIAPELIYSGWSGEIPTRRFPGENLLKVLCTLRAVGFNSKSGNAFPLVWHRPDCVDTPPL